MPTSSEVAAHHAVPDGFVVRAGAMSAVAPSGTAPRTFDVTRLGLRSLALSGADLPTVGLHERVSLHIDAAGSRCEGLVGTVTYLAQDVGRGDDRFALELTLDTPTPEQARVLARAMQALRLRGDILDPAVRIIEHEIIDEPSRVARVFEALHAAEHLAVLWHRDAQGRRAGFPKPAKLTRDGRLLALYHGIMAPERARDTDASRVEVQVRGFGSNFIFAVDLDGVDAHGRLKPPVSIQRVRYRQYRRVEAEPGMVTTLRHPIWPDIEITRPVLNASLDGLSIATDLVDDLLFPGVGLSGVTVTWKGGTALTFDAHVRHVSPKIHGLGDSCGLQITPASEAVRHAWSAELEAVLYPSTTLDQGRDADVWRLYGDSGYFRLSGKSEQHFAPLREPFMHTGERFRHAPKIAARVVCGGAARVEATATEVKMYAGTWLGYQAARYPDGRPLAYAGNDVVRDVYVHALEYPQRDPDFRWHITYVQDVAQLSRINLDTPLRYVAGGRACVVPFHAFELDCRSEETLLPTGIVVTDASPDDETRIRAAVAARFPT
ncbi:MAG: hypothetical protein AAB426_00365, partial [Myxococcota bacterium]